jgi:nucleoid DNA-binding protein
MRKTDLAVEIAKQTGISFVRATKTINLVFESIGKVLKKGERVCITGFGTFKTRTQKSSRITFDRKHFIKVPSTKVVDFVSGKRLKKLVRRKVKDLFTEV